MNLDERLAALEANVNGRFQSGADRMDCIERNLKTNTEATERVEANTAEMLEFFNAMKGAFKVLNWIGKAARPVGVIALAVGAIASAWAALKGHFR